MALNKGWMHTKSGDVSFLKGIFWGAAGGAIGSYFSSPFFMVSKCYFICDKLLKFR